MTMRVIVGFVISCTIYIGFAACSRHDVAYPTRCQFEDDCLTVKCGLGVKRDENNCTLKNCPCQTGFIPPDNSCVCVRSPCPCPVSCPRLTCPKDCDALNGWILDDEGCNTCRCRPPCPEIDCKRSCPNGYKRDRNGCQTCQCKADVVPPVCLPVLCAKPCPHGVIVDERGCSTCQCKPPPICPLIKCAKDCGPRGFRKDRDGCETCECNCGPLCRKACRFGFVEDQFGCPTCQCKSSPQWSPWSRWSSCSGTCGVGVRTRARECSDPSGDGELCPGSDRETEQCKNEKPCACRDLLCDVHCPHGHVNDEHGCPTCTCKLGPVCPLIRCHRNCGPLGTRLDENGCPTCQCNCGPVCAIFCEFGNVEDEFGCPTCECKPRPCPLVRCPQTCKFGFKNDKNGCQTCECNPPPCPAVRCAQPCRFGFKTDENGCQTCQCNCGPVCKIFCPFGNVLDDNGCPTCKCNPRPCPLVRCAEPCEFGFKKDKDGCQTCECNPPPQWGSWSQWTSCSVTCGVGVRSRTRECSDPSGDGELCPGSDLRTQSCRKRRPCRACRRHRCRRHCPHGYIKDWRGCDTCACKPRRDEKPGTCPRLRTPGRNSFCRKDSDCSGSKKCCPLRPTVNVCVQPIH